MGTWGTGIGQNDTFCEIQEEFRSRAKDSNDYSAIAKEILSEESDNPDYLNVIYALTDALWHSNALEPDLFEKILYYHAKGIDQDEWRANGADERMLKKRNEKLQNFITKLSRQPKKNEIWKLNKPTIILPQRGQLFWYRIKKTSYGALVIDIQDKGFFLLVAITEALDSKRSYTADDLINIPLYTLAWFSEDCMMPERRRHNITVFDIEGDYNGKFGFSCSDGGLMCSNCGSTSTWMHESRSFAWQGKTITAMLTLDKTVYSRR